MELTLDLDDEVYDQVVRRSNRHNFDSPEEYGTIIIETVIDELESEDDAGANEDVQDRLEDLGYL